STYRKPVLPRTSTENPESLRYKFGRGRVKRGAMIRYELRLFGRIRVVGIGTYTFNFIPVRVVDVEGANALEDRVHTAPHLESGFAAAPLEVVVLGRAQVEGQVVEHALRLLPREGAVGFGMGNQHDHLGNRPLARPRPQELVAQLGRADHRQPKQVSVEAERAVEVAHPQHDLGQVAGGRGYAASAMALRCASRARGGTEQPGATSTPTPPVAA